MHQDSPPTPPATPTASWHRALSWLRTGLLLTAALISWYLVLGWWTWASEDTYGLFDVARLTVTITLAVLTVLWIISFRFHALRRALLPFEGGIVMGLALLVSGNRGIEADTNGDVFGIAMFTAIGGAIVLAFVVPLVERRRSGPLWIGGIIVAGATLAVALPWLGDWVVDDGAYLPDMEATAQMEVMRRILDDGVSIGLHGAFWESPPLSIDAGFSDEMDGAPEVTASGAADRQDAAHTISAQLIADESGSLVVHLSALAVASGGAQVRLERGSCTNRSDAHTIEEWRVEDASVASHRTLTNLKLNAVAPDEQVRLLIGRGGALQPVRCISGLDAIGRALADANAAGFSERCITSLDLSKQQRLQVTAASLQDPTCAQELTRLADIARPHVDETDFGAPVPVTDGSTVITCDPSMPVC